jgi:hypothetical protein
LRNSYDWKIYPLKEYLLNIPNNQKEVTITFEKIERILNAKLPSSAYQYQAWWANQKEGSHVEAQTWLDAGWWIDTVNFKDS